MDWLNKGPDGWMASLALYFAVLIAFSAVLYFLVAKLERKLVLKGFWPFKTSFMSRFFLALEFLFVSLALLLVPNFLRIPRSSMPEFQSVTRALIILSTTWVLLKAIDAATALWIRSLRVDRPDNLRERRLRTQILYLERVVDIVILLAAFGLLLMGFEQFRRVGGSLLASAGLVSLIVGFAAQRSLGNIIAGLQIAFTQPIRLGDAIFIENEWGEVEEITLTYVVVRLWDLRRMVVPINFFLEKPFQNWTRRTADLIGAVLLSVDYATPVEVIRREYSRLLRQSPLWDGHVDALQVVDSNDRTITIRALMSARNAGHLWDLRCEIREKLIAFIRDQYPEALPRSRVDYPREARPVA